MNNIMISRRKQQLVGLGIALIGAGFTGWTWYTALYYGYFYLKASLLFPASLIIGLALIIFPGYKEERIAIGQDISLLQGIRLITPRWWAILITALAAGGLNYLLLSSFDGELFVNVDGGFSSSAANYCSALARRLW
jgi:hypothetical protein